MIFSGCSKSKKVLLVGRDTTWFPKQYGVYTANINAFLNDLVAEISRCENMNINLVNQDWIHLFENLDERKTAGALTSIFPTSEMLSHYRFSEPVLLTGPVLVVPEGSPYRSMEDLQGKLIGVYKFDSSVLIAQDVPNAVLVSYQQVAPALEGLCANCYDALLVPVIDATALIETMYKGRLQIVSQPLNQEGLRLVVLRGKNTDLLEGFNMGLVKSMRSGKYQTLKENNRLP